MQITVNPYLLMNGENYHPGQWRKRSAGRERPPGPRVSRRRLLQSPSLCRTLSCALRCAAFRRCFRQGRGQVSTFSGLALRESVTKTASLMTATGKQYELVESLD